MAGWPEPTQTAVYVPPRLEAPPEDRQECLTTEELEDVERDLVRVERVRRVLADAADVLCAIELC